MTPAARGLGTGLLVVALAAACRTPTGPPRSAERAAEAFVAWARQDAPRLPDAAELVEPALLSRHGGALAEAASFLRGAGPAAIRAISPVDAQERVAIDLESSSPGAGRLRFGVTAARAPDGTFRIVAFTGPGWSWPPSAPAAGEGLTTSPPPRRDPARP